MNEDYPMRINKYLAHKKYTTRRGADEIIEAKLVTINGKLAVLGDKVNENDNVIVRAKSRTYRYFAYNKPKGIVTHSPQDNELDIASQIDLKHVFPLGRLDKESTGLIILTDDGRATGPLLSPESDHEKEYVVTTAHDLRSTFKQHMEAGVDIGGYTTKPAKVTILGTRKFSITLTEGKKHQIRRMTVALHTDVAELERVRIMNIRLSGLKPGEYRELTGDELKTFLAKLGL